MANTSLQPGVKAANEEDDWRAWDVGRSTAKSLQSCPTLCDPIDGSLPGSSAHGIFQARVLTEGKNGKLFQRRKCEGQDTNMPRNGSSSVKTAESTEELRNIS